MTAVLKSISCVSYVIIIYIWLKWYFHIDITPNTLRFSIYPEEAYTEPVKALDDQNQSVLIVASISDASLRLRPNTPTLKRTPIDTQTYYQWDSAGSIQSEAVSPYHRWNTTSYRTCISIIYLNIWELCCYSLTTRTSAILVYSALSMSSLDNTTARDI